MNQLRHRFSLGLLLAVSLVILPSRLAAQDALSGDFSKRSEIEKRLAAARGETSALGMLTYSAAVTLFLGHVGFAGGFSDILLWPAVSLHAVLALALAYPCRTKTSNLPLKKMHTLTETSGPGRRRTCAGCVRALVLLSLSHPCSAQDIEPRRWSHLPLGGNFGGVAYAYTEGDIFFNPVQRIEDGEFELNSAAFKYIHAFELLEKSARIDLVQMYQSGSWSGLVGGVPGAIERDGWADTALRFAVNLYGAPPLEGQEFIEYRKATHCETIVGAGLVVTLPTGEYFEDKPINLCANRYTLTPQFGVVHTRGRWSMALSSSVTFFTDNDTFTIGCSLQW